METISKSPEQTKEIARDLAKRLKKGGIICLFGDLGAGKTVFTQGLAQGLKIKNRILSPSFVLEREYDLGEGRKFYHIDLYRIDVFQDARGLGLEEILCNKNNIVAIEWAEKIKNFLPKKRINVFISIVNEKERRIRIEKSG